MMLLFNSPEYKLVAFRYPFNSTWDNISNISSTHRWPRYKPLQHIDEKSIVLLSSHSWKKGCEIYEKTYNVSSAVHSE